MIGRTLSHFQITAKLGEGGMGEVYRAEDTKLGREVAIKVLPESLTADPERLARFEREARVLASLNHPSIAGIYEVGQATPATGSVVHFLVMELAEGEDLAERLARGPLPLASALVIARQIAEALEAAHERGIVHRDLKPANIKLIPDGPSAVKVKVLDFGLAKDWGATAEASPDLTRSPTLTARMTRQGVILGTAAYMSPEQARGEEADPRADIWGLGVVIYEMLAGRSLFAEPTVSDTLAAVLRAELDWEALPVTTPRAVRRLLARCLEREPKRRYHAAADLRLDLDEAIEGDTGVVEPDPPAARRRRWILAAAATALALVVTVAALWQGTAGRSAPGQRVVASVLPPPETEFVLDLSGLSISADGARLAFVARDATGVEALWVRSLTRGTLQRIPGTVGAQGPFWSPDGRSLGFTQDGQLKTLELESGLTETLASQSLSVGAAWSPAGEIVFAGGEEIPLRAVRRTGGAPRQVTENPAAGDYYFAPDFLPDGKHFIFHSRRYASEEQFGQIRLGSLDGEPSRVLFETFSVATYVEPGFILWWHQGNLRAQRFDPERLELVGEPFAVASNVRWDPRSAFAVFAASDSGVLVYQPGGRVAGNQLTWFGRHGEALGTVGEAGSLYSPRISPDGSRIALDVSGDSNQGDIWVLDAARGSGTRLTVWPEDDTAPVWSPDGRELMFVSGRGGTRLRLFRTSVAAATEPQPVLSDPDLDLVPSDWSADGRTLALTAGTSASKDLWALTLDSGEVRRVTEWDFAIDNAALSSNGRWIAYDSNETGRREVYLADFPAVERRMRVSTAGGFAPVWSGDGTELFYATPGSDAIVAVSVTAEGGHRALLGRPETLFRVDMKEEPTRQFDTLDGERFLVNANVNTSAQTPLTLVLHWTEEP